MNQIRVLVVDDHEVVRAGLTSILSREKDLLVLDAMARAEDAIDSLETLAPDVIVLDYSLKGISGAMACEEIKRRRPSTAVLILTCSSEDSVLMSCLAAGASGFLIKNADGVELVAGIRTVAAGRPTMAPEALHSLLRWIQGSQVLGLAGDHLTPQESAALSLAAQGRKNRDIAHCLNVTESAVKARLDGARRKLGARGRSGAVLTGIRRGMI